jgi:hypothetical protein
MDRRVTITVAAVGVYVLVHLAHGIVHGLIPVWLLPVQLAVVVGIIFGGPLIGVGLLLRDYQRWGSVLVMLTGGVAFGAEVGWHFVIPNPDNIAHVHEAQLAFGTTAVLAVLTDAVVVLAGMNVWRDESPR